jgi:hypothetical protein
MSKLRLRVLTSAAFAAVVAGGSLAAAAPVSAQSLSLQWSRTFYVSPDAPGNGSGKDRDHSCANAKFSSIQDAIEGVHLGGTVVTSASSPPANVTVPGTTATTTSSRRGWCGDLLRQAVLGKPRLGSAPLIRWAGHCRGS